MASSGSERPAAAGGPSEAGPGPAGLSKAGPSEAGAGPAGAAPAGPGPGRPVIGLTTYRERAQTLVWDTEFALLHNVYVDGVARAGGVPILLPPQEHGAEEAIARLDGLVLTGGSDVDPERYQQLPDQHTTVVRPWRDDWELRLLDRALAAGLPVLGVCRGAQLLNVALGGTLDQHLPDTVGHQRHCPEPGVFGQTRVSLEAGSALAEILGLEATVACYHHQAIGKVAPELAVVGRSDDGTVEAVELPGRPFVLAVQWHPEQDGGDLSLFAALVAAARKKAVRKKAARNEAAGNEAARNETARKDPAQNQGASLVGP